MYVFLFKFEYSLAAIAPLVNSSAVTSYGMDMHPAGDADALPSNSNGGYPVSATSTTKRKRKSTSNEKNGEDHQPAKRANIRSEATTASLATASGSASTAQPSNQSSNSNCRTPQQQLLHDNSNHLHPPAASAATPVVAASELSSDSSSAPPSVPVSDYDLTSPQSITSIVSPIPGPSPSPSLFHFKRNSNGQPTRKPIVLVKKNPNQPSPQPAPDKRPRKKKLRGAAPDDYICAITHSSDLRLCPLPALAWAEASDVWRTMCMKDDRTMLLRDPRMLSKHPGIQARMRAILLDWLIEVCEVYKLHRETYYLSVDYLDRFLTANVKISKTRLQLIGITCLFVAAKVEEIYPPKIAEFAYVTDGACTEEDILQQELILLTSLKWSISPVTIIGWLSVYMQLNCSNRTPESLITVVNNPSASGSNGNSHLGQKAADDESNGRPDQSATPYSDSGSLESPAPLSVSDDGGVEVHKKSDTPEGDAFVYPQFSGMEFARLARVLDLCTLDLNFSLFPYSAVAAAAISLAYDK